MEVWAHMPLLFFSGSGDELFQVVGSVYGLVGWPIGPTSCWMKFRDHQAG